MSRALTGSVNVRGAGAPTLPLTTAADVMPATFAPALPADAGAAAACAPQVPTITIVRMKTPNSDRGFSLSMVPPR